MNTNLIEQHAVNCATVQPYNWTGLTAIQLVRADRLSRDKAADEMTNNLEEADFVAWGITLDDADTALAAYTHFRKAVLNALN